MSRASANLLLLLAGAIWGLGFVAQSTAMEALGPFAYTAFKFALAALTLAPFAFFEHRRRAERLAPGALIGFVAVGLALFLAAITQQIGLLTTSVTNSGFLTGLYVVVTPFLALLVFKARPHKVVWPASLAAFAGIALLGGGDLGALEAGDLWTIVSAMFWAVQIVLVQVAMGRAGPRPYGLAFVQFAVTALLSAALAIILENPTLAAAGAAAVEILYGGIVAAGLAFTLQILAQRHTTAAQAAIFLSSEALFAGLFGALLLGERIGPAGLLGCGLIFLAMLAVEIVPGLKGFRRKRRPAA